MNEPNEFQISQHQSDLEALRDFVPEYRNERVEPWTPPVVDSVRPPEWNKIKLGDAQVSGGGGSGFNPALFQCVIGVQEGGFFVPKLAYVIGPLTDL